ncbi:MAG: DUF6062 family protein [Anaerolineae bacterium]
MTDMISLQIKLACREAGCPLCRLRRDSERRYLFGFLWENVNDGSIRKHLVQALGFCPDHAWQLQEIEQTRWSDGLGTAIVYEDLTNRALKALQTYRDTLADRRLPLRERLRGWVGGLVDDRGPARHDRASAQGPADLVPRATCRACDIGDDADRRYVAWLVRDCVESADLHQAYQDSDGLCLPHLRQALAEEGDPEAARFLVDVAIEHAGNLVEDLSEYIRKHIHEYRREPMSDNERESWIRAVAWFAGEKRLTDAEATKVKQGR